MTDLIHRNDVADEVYIYQGEDSFHNKSYKLLRRNIDTRFSHETNFVYGENGEQIKTTAKFVFDSDDVGYLPAKSKIIKDKVEYIVEDTSSPPGILNPLYTKVLCRRKDNV